MAPANRAVLELPGDAPSWLSVVTAAEDPDLWLRVRAEGVFAGVWPEYNQHGNHTDNYFGVLFERFAHLQVLLVDRRSDRPVARGRTIGFRWDGRDETLPAGIDALGLAAVEETAPNAVSALAAEVVPDLQGQGLSRLVLASMVAAARAAGLAPLVAPVRPSGKDRYPLTPIERYAAWVRPDGLPVDDWLRVHVRMGGRIVRPAPRSLEITAPVADWTAWTGLDLPEDGEYTFPLGLAPVVVRDGVGRYFEPNVWVRHEVPAA